jgi:hypothetical protein
MYCDHLQTSIASRCWFCCAAVQDLNQQVLGFKTLLCKPIANVLPAVEEELPDDHYVITDRVVAVNMATSRVVVIMPRPLYRVGQDAGFYEVRRNGWLAMDCAGYA